MLTGFDLCRAALAVADISAPEQSVLMVLAIMANDEARCWPPINGCTGLTGKTKLSERSVQRSLQALRESGHINWQDITGKGRIYLVHPRLSGTPATETPATVAPVPEGQETPATVAPKQPVTTIPQKALPSSGKRAGKPLPTPVPVDFVPEAKPDSITGKVMAAWPPGELEEQLEHFIDRHTTQRTLSHDWQASWRTWVKNWKRFNGNRPNRRMAGEPDLRGARPDPSLDLLYAARRAEEAECAAGGGPDHRGTRLALPARGAG